MKLGDFGLARDIDSPMLTVADTAVGTANYLPPEQALGDSSIDQRADLYALGCNLFQCIPGHPPFAYADSLATTTLMEMMRRHIEDAPPSLHESSFTCPADLSLLVEKLLEKSREERPTSAAEVIVRLQAILDRQPAPPFSSPTPNPESDKSKSGSDRQSSQCENFFRDSNPPVEIKECSLTERLHVSPPEPQPSTKTRLVYIGIFLVAIVVITSASALPILAQSLN